MGCDDEENAMRKPAWPLMMALATLMVAPALAQQPAEQQVMELANADRAQQGLPPLKWDPALAQAAVQHAQIMAEQPAALSHQYAGEPDLVARAGAAGAHFRSVAENVAVAPSPQALEEEWMHSPLHRANIMNPMMNGIGVGLVRRGGNYYAVEDFDDGVAQLGQAQIEQKIGQLLQQRGLQPAGLTEYARKTCALDQGSAGGPKPWFIMRWEGTDLGRLPEVLEEKIATGKYHKAAVGACDSGNPGQGFATYKLAVMLY
jgi:Cysteine-rich secretory protein family